MSKTLDCDQIQCPLDLVGNYLVGQIMSTAQEPKEKPEQTRIAEQPKQIFVGQLYLVRFLFQTTDATAGHLGCAEQYKRLC